MSDRPEALPAALAETVSGRVGTHSAPASAETLAGPLPGHRSGRDPGPEETAAPAAPRRTAGYGEEVTLRADAGLAEEQRDRYRWLGALGEGGIGFVDRVYDRQMGREVALKVLKGTPSHPEDGLAPAELRFLDEARITGQLEHPGVVPVYEVGRRSDGAVYYCMKRVRGGTLAAALEGRPLHERLRQLPRFIALCQTIAYAHSRGVVHRDLKPANVMLGDFGETVVLDWGLAKVGDRGAESVSDVDLVEQMRADQTRAGQVMGTPAYMAPEQARGDADRVGAPSDVYALGAILYEILTGRVPFVADTVSELAELVQTRLAAPASEVEPKCPPELSAIASRALAKATADRYPDAGAMAADLVAFREGELVSAHTYGLGEVLRRHLRRHRQLAVMLGVLIAAVTGAWWWRGVEEADRAAEVVAREERVVATKVRRLLRAAAADDGPERFDIYTFRLIALRSPTAQARLTAALDDESPAVRRLAARALGGMGNRAAGRALVDRLAEGAEPDDAVLVEVIRALGAIGDPNTEHAVFEARRRAGRHSPVWASTELANRMIPLAPIPEASRAQAGPWVERGAILLEKGRLKEALAAYGHALALDPAAPRAHLGRAAVRHRLADYGGALQDFDDALRGAPDDPEGLAGRAATHELRRDLVLARADLDRWIVLAPASARARRARARVLWSLGDLEGARIDLDAAARRGADPFAGALAEAQFAGARGDLPEAEVRASSAIALRASAAAFTYRARVRVGRGDLLGARLDLDQAIAAEGAHRGLLADRAALWMDLGEVARAEADLERSTRWSRHGGAAFMDRAMVLHAARRDWGAARRDLTRARQRAAPGEQVLIGLLQAATARALGVGDPLGPLQPVGAQPWHDALLPVARGQMAAVRLLGRARTPAMRCELDLANHLGRGPPLPPAAGFAASPAPIAHPACRLMAALR